MTKDWAHSRKQVSWENKYSFNIIFQRWTFRTCNIKLADCLSSGLIRSLDQKVSFLSCGFCFIACGCMESVLLVVLPNHDLLVQPSLQGTSNYPEVSVAFFVGWVDLKHATQFCLYTTPPSFMMVELYWFTIAGHLPCQFVIKCSSPSRWRSIEE